MVDLAKSIQDLGLAGIIVFLVLVAAVGLHRQWWVPGWVYRALETRAEKSDLQAMRNAEALEKMARQANRNADSLEKMAQSSVDDAPRRVSRSKAPDASP